MTNTAKKINPYVTRRMLTNSEAACVRGGDASMEGCSHYYQYKTGNYRKKKIGFIWSIDEEYYCPNCGYRHYVWDISFS